MKVRVLDRQSVLDIALQAGGGLEAALELAWENDVSISGELAAGAELETTGVVDAAVAGRYAARGIRPATALSPGEPGAAPAGGIGYMAIGIDFIIS
ncbi:MAG: hypothetical protein LBP56_07690 [Odoribacteraceae bacterium]|jgi:hypothetical protein|nr:hypothetical protein [Odoribacteraceae bacterium]